MSEQTPINISNVDFTFKDKYGNTGLNKGISTDDGTKLNNMVKLMNLMLNTPNSTDFINTLATKQYVDENQSSGLNLFDIVAKDHVLTYGKDLEGFAPLGTWVYKTAVDGSRYGYPDFVQKCLDEYDEAIADTITFDNVTLDIKRHSNGHIYFDVADIETVNTYFNTYGHAWFYGIDEINERVFLPRQAHGKLIESYKNGTDWYRIYEDGFCEQGGYDSGSSIIISLLTEMANTNYDVLLQTQYNSSGAISGAHNYIQNKTVTQFERATGDNNPCYWIVYGYANISNLQITPSYEYMVVGNVKVEQASTEVIDVTTTNNDTVPLFTAHYFDYTPNNLSWLKGGEQSNSGDLYKTCYNELVNVLNGETKYGSLKVIDESDMVQGEDYSLYWIVNQTTQTFRTPTKTQQRFVIKTYQSGTDWYRIYNDGWCEQGGQSQRTNTGNTDVTLLKNFASTNYTLTYGAFSPVNGTDANVISTTINKTNSSFTVRTFDYTNGNRASGINWQASGYIDLTNETFDTSLYFKVANVVENMELLDVSKVTEVLTSKADITLANASNIAQSFKDMSIGWGMPDWDSKVQIAYALSSSYTVPEYGYIYIKNANDCNYFYSTINGLFFNVWLASTGMFPVRPNDIYMQDSKAGGGNPIIYFVPCKGV